MRVVKGISTLAHAALSQLQGWERANPITELRKLSLSASVANLMKCLVIYCAAFSNVSDSGMLPRTTVGGEPEVVRGVPLGALGEP
eukprot:966405-Pyramimonas_sp.AAC.1